MPCCAVLGPGVFATVVTCIETGKVRPLVAAQQAFLDKTLVGKIVLLPPG